MGPRTPHVYICQCVQCVWQWEHLLPLHLLLWVVGGGGGVGALRGCPVLYVLWRWQVQCVSAW
jgi:hypothetical protein